jgi:hypothetical protein
MRRAEALLEIIHEAVTATTESTPDSRRSGLCGTGHWRATCGENRMRRSEGGRRFAQSSGEPKGPQRELKGLHVLRAVLVLGFAGAGGVVLFGGGRQELAGDGGVLDGGGVVDAEHGGEVQGVGAVGEGFLELPVDAEPFEGGREAAA